MATRLVPHPAGGASGVCCPGPGWLVLRLPPWGEGLLSSQAKGGHPGGARGPGPGLWETWAPGADSPGGSGLRGQRGSLWVLPATRAASVVGGLPVPAAEVARVWWRRKARQLLGAQWGRPRGGKEPPRGERGTWWLRWAGQQPGRALKATLSCLAVSRLGRGHLLHLKDWPAKGHQTPGPSDPPSTGPCVPPQTLTAAGAALGQRVDHGGQEHGAVVDLPKGQASRAVPGRALSSGALAARPCGPGPPAGCWEGRGWRARLQLCVEWTVEGLVQDPLEGGHSSQVTEVGRGREPNPALGPGPTRCVDLGARPPTWDSRPRMRFSCSLSPPRCLAMKSTL